MFLNFSTAKYPSLNEEGRILVIKHSMFDTAIQPWVDWKRQLGFTVNVVDVTEAGSSATGIKNFIQAQYDLNDGLMFVQLVVMDLKFLLLLILEVEVILPMHS